MHARTRWLTIALLVALGASAQASSAETRADAAIGEGHPLQGELNRISNVRFHLQDGDFRIVGGDSDEITIRTNGKNAAQAKKKMKVQIRRTGDALDVTFTRVPKSEVQVTIAIPRETALYARMRAGDLSIDGVTGDKDLELLAGDLSVQVSDPADYGPVDLSVRLGDLSGSQFGDPRGRVGNSLRRDGSGKYRLHAHVFAGDLTLKP
jgi:hypothetical protein